MEEEYKDYGLPTAEEIEQHCKSIPSIEAARWMRRKAVESIDKLNRDNLEALVKILRGDNGKIL